MVQQFHEPHATPCSLNSTGPNALNQTSSPGPTLPGAKPQGNSRLRPYTMRVTLTGLKGKSPNIGGCADKNRA